jgi:hypothetical protein
VEEPALVHWPDGTEDVLKVYPQEDRRPFAFAEHVYLVVEDTNEKTAAVSRKVKRVTDREWRVARQERRAGTLEGGRAYALEVWVESTQEE